MCVFSSQYSTLAYKEQRCQDKKVCSLCFSHAASWKKPGCQPVVQCEKLVALSIGSVCRNQPWKCILL